MKVRWNMVKLMVLVALSTENTTINSSVTSINSLSRQTKVLDFSFIRINSSTLEYMIKELIGIYKYHLLS